MFTESLHDRLAVGPPCFPHLSLFAAHPVFGTVTSAPGSRAFGRNELAAAAYKPASGEGSRRKWLHV